MRPYALATLARARLSGGRVHEALATAREAEAALVALGEATEESTYHNRGMGGPIPGPA
jgi:DNA-binding transcriptional regulator LsrR (DeoR family)